MFGIFFLLVLLWIQWLRAGPWGEFRLDLEIYWFFRSLNCGNFPESGSSVNTLLKYWRNTPAFSVSFRVYFGSSSVPGIKSSGMDDRVFNLCWVYFQKPFGFSLHSAAILFSNSFFPLLVSRRIWFLILLYWSFSSSEASSFLIFPHSLFLRLIFLRFFLSRGMVNFCDSLPLM